MVRLNYERVVQHVSADFNAARVGSATTETDWLEILKEGLTGFSEVYIIIDMEVLGQSPEDEGKSWLKFFRHFEALVGNLQGVVVKVAILSFRQDFIRIVSPASPSVRQIPLRRLNYPACRSKGEEESAMAA